MHFTSSGQHQAEDLRLKSFCHVKWVNPSYALCLVSLLILLGNITKRKMCRTKEKHGLGECRKVGEKGADYSLIKHR